MAVIVVYHTIRRVAFYPTIETTTIRSPSAKASKASKTSQTSKTESGTDKAKHGKEIS